jgi:hypothetical protein
MRPGREIYHSCSSRTEVTNAWSYASNPSYFFMTSWLIKDNPIIFLRRWIEFLEYLYGWEFSVPRNWFCCCYQIEQYLIIYCFNYWTKSHNTVNGWQGFDSPQELCDASPKSPWHVAYPTSHPIVIRGFFHTNIGAGVWSYWQSRQCMEFHLQLFCICMLSWREKVKKKKK